MKYLTTALYYGLFPVWEILIFITYLFFKLFPTPKAREISYGDYKNLAEERVNKSYLLSYLEIFLASIIYNILFHFPYRVYSVVVYLCTMPLYLIFISSHRIIKINIQIAFPEKYTPAQLQKVIRKNFFNSMKFIGEVARFKALKRNFLIKNTTVKGLEHIEMAYAKKQGVLLFSGHFGNFLYVMIYLVLVKEMKASFIIRRLDNPFIGYITYNLFSDIGINCIIRGPSAIKSSIQALRRGEIVYLLMDQNVAIGGIFVPFFNLPASTFRGVFKIQELTKCAIVGCNDFHDKLEKHTLNYYPEIPVQKTEYDLILKINQQLEEFISLDPSQHLWLHPRWKRRPDDSSYQPYASIKNIAKK